MPTLDDIFERLSHSKFRSSFHLTKKDLAMVSTLGTEKLREHAAAFVASKLAPAFPPNDGKQTPYRGHPIFKAMHATALCCRGCMNKWYRVPLGMPLNQHQQDKLVVMLLTWIERQMPGTPTQQ